MNIVDVSICSHRPSGIKSSFLGLHCNHKDGFLQQPSPKDLKVCLLPFHPLLPVTGLCGEESLFASLVCWPSRLPLHAFPVNGRAGTPAPQSRSIHFSGPGQPSQHLLRPIAIGQSPLQHQQQQPMRRLVQFKFIAFWDWCQGLWDESMAFLCK